MIDLTTVDTTELITRYETLLNSLKDTQLHRFEKVRMVYDFMDFHNTLLIEEKSVCAQGCAHCCSINVDMTEVEAAYLSHHTKIPLNANINAVPSEQLTNTQPCLFLDKETLGCSIYEYRPSVCRMYHVFESPDKCKNKEEQYQVTLNDAALIQPLVLEQFILALSENDVLKQERAGLRDIRQWFTHAK